MIDYEQKSTTFFLPTEIQRLLGEQYVSASPIVPLETDENGRTRRAPMQADSLELDLCRHMLPLCYDARTARWEKAPCRSCYRDGSLVRTKKCLTKANSSGWPKQLARFCITNPEKTGDDGEFKREFVNHLDSLARHALPTTPDADAWSYGFLLGEGYIAIDCDIDDVNLSAKFLNAFVESFPTAPIRTRGGSRWASILHVIDNPESNTDGMTITLNLVHTDDASKPQQVEFLGRGRQLAIQGWHTSGARYVLYRGDLTTIPDTDMREVESLRCLLADIAVTNGVDLVETKGRSINGIKFHTSQRRIEWDGMNYGAGPGGICRSEVPIYTLIRQVVNDARADHLRKSDLYLSEDDEKIYFKCPNAHNHTSEEHDKDTCMFKDGGGFKCLHAHCEIYDFDTALFATFTPPYLKTLIDNQFGNLKEHKEKKKTGTDENGTPIYENVNVAYVDSWKATPAALRHYLTHEEFCPVRFSYDTFTQRHYVEFMEQGIKKELDDTVSTEILLMLSEQNVALRTLSPCAIDSFIRTLCEKNPYDSVIEYVDKLPKWDGTERVSDFFTKYTKNVSDSPDEHQAQWESACANLLFTSLIARMTNQDGIQSDISLVLKGGQGIGKSTLCRILAGEYSRFQELTFCATDKDRASSLAGKTVVEVAELAGMNKRTTEEIKFFLTTTVDKYRPAYGRYEVSRPRRCIFIFTTNESRFLKDATGNRRFAVIDLGEGKTARKFDFETLRCDYTQLMAEAKVLFEKNGIMWQGVQCLSAEMNTSAVETDVWEDSYKDALNDATWTSMKHLYEIACSRLGAQLCNWGKREKDRVGGIMRHLGFLPRNVKINGDVIQIYVRSDSDVNNAQVRGMLARGIYSDSKEMMLQAPTVPSDIDNMLFT